MGSGLGLRGQLIKEGKMVDLVSAFDLPVLAEVLPQTSLIEKKNVSKLDFDKYDLVITLDGGNARQFADVASDSDFNFGGALNILNIDHHLGSMHFAKYEIWDPKASSTSEVLLSTLIDIDLLSKDEATLLYAGLLGDTGNFKYNFSAKTLQLASKLIDKGADFKVLVNQYFYSNQKSDFKILSRAMDRTKFNDKLGYSYLVVNEKLWKKELNVKHKEMESGLYLYKNIFLRSIDGINIGFILVKTGKGFYVQFRGNSYHNKIPLFQIGSSMGVIGQGHANAGGFIVEESDAEVLLEKLEKVLVKLVQKYNQL